jgi:hypothetical protein
MTDEKQNYFDLLPTEIIEIIFIQSDNEKLHLVSKRFEIIANSDYVVKNKCVCLKHYYHFELAGEYCKANNHNCVCNLGYTTSIEHCRANEHPCVCSNNAHNQEVCKCKVHTCTCDSDSIHSVIGCRFEGRHKCSCDYYLDKCKVHNE